MGRLTPEQRAIARALVKKRSDHHLQYRPNEVQKACLESRAHYRAMNGANQIGGKTYGMAQELRMYYTQKHPWLDVPNGSKFLVLVPGRRQAADPWAKYLIQGDPGARIFHNRYPMLPMDKDVTKVHWDRTVAPACPRFIKNLKNQVEIWFWWSGYAGLEKFIQGMQFFQVSIDESAGTQAVMDELRPRLGESRERNPDAGRIMWGATETEANPAYQTFIDHCRSPDFPDYQLFTVDSTIFERGSVMSRGVWEALYEGVDDEERQIRLEGTGSRAGGLRVYPEFADHPERYFLKEPYKPMEDDNILVSLDPGMGHNGGLCVAFVNKKMPARLHVKQAWFAPNRGPSWWTSLLIDYLDGRKMTAFIPDKYQYGKRDYGGENKTIRQQFVELLDDDELWVANNWLGRMIHVDQHHDIGQLKMHQYLKPWPELTSVRASWLVFDPPTPYNGMGEMRRQLVNYHSRGDPDHRGVFGVVKKDDEGPDLCRMLVMFGHTWKDFGPNLPHGIYDPEAKAPAEYEDVSEERMAELRKKRASKNIADQWRKRREGKKPW